MVMVFPSEGTEMVVNEEPMTLVDGEAKAKVVNIVVGGWEKKIGSYSVTKLDVYLNTDDNWSLYIMCTCKFVTIPTKLVEPCIHTHLL
jgi:hypothetical protein